VYEDLPDLQGRYHTYWICTHLGAVVVYDAGKVALRKNDLNFSDLRQGFRGGVAIYLGKDIIFRMAVAHILQCIVMVASVSLGRAQNAAPDGGNVPPFDQLVVKADAARDLNQGLLGEDRGWMDSQRDSESPLRLPLEPRRYDAWA